MQIYTLRSPMIITMDAPSPDEAFSVKAGKTRRSPREEKVKPGENLHKEMRQSALLILNDARPHPSFEFTKLSEDATPSNQASFPENSLDRRLDKVVFTNQPELNCQPIATLLHSGSTPPPKNKMKKLRQPKPNKIRSDLKKPALQHFSAPIPTAGYLNKAHGFLTQTLLPQRLLLVLDLNGTLLYRPSASSDYLPRPSLAPFLAYCLANHSILIWSSASPQNVSAICAKLFQPQDRRNLLGEWARDTLGLTPEQYTSKFQVYKRLEQIWHDPHLSASHPLASQGQRWGQKNTLLIDDSPVKASAQPYNLLRIPEFIKNTTEIDVLGQVVGYIEATRRRDNVSAYVCSRKFEVDDGWTWDWEKLAEKRKRRVERNSAQELVMPSEGSVASSDVERGGVRLEGWLET